MEALLGRSRDITLGSRIEFSFEGFMLPFFFLMLQNISCLYYSVRMREKVAFSTMVVTTENSVSDT